MIAAPAESVKLSGVFDGLLMFGAPDAYASATPKLTYEPWELLSKCIKGLEVETYFGGSMFLAAGTFCERLLDTAGTGK